MGLLRWLLWPKRSKDDDEDDHDAREWKRTKKAHHPGVYRVEVDGESQKYKGEGPPFSFWGSSRIILILSFLLWWIQPAGPMIAGYVGGRRAGSPMKGVIAALLPVLAIFVANAAYARTVATQQIDFVGTLPNVIGDGAASILPFLAPYKDFMIAYLSGFVQALQSTFGMGTNGYLMVVIFAYIGGLIAEQTRRELYFRNGANQSVGVNLVQPLIAGRHFAAAEEDEYDDPELHEMRRPVRAAHARGARGRHKGRHRRGTPERFDDYRKVYADGSEMRGRHGRREYDDEDEVDEEDEEAPVRHSVKARAPEHHVKARATRAEEAEDEEEEDAASVARREAKEYMARKAHTRSREEEVALQRFVDRALRNYDHSKL